MSVATEKLADMIGLAKAEVRDIFEQQYSLRNADRQRLEQGESAQKIFNERELQAYGDQNKILDVLRNLEESVQEIIDGENQ